MDEHLDWHFRQNKRIKETSKHPVSRDWFVSEHDWIHEVEASDECNALFRLTISKTTVVPS
jgi:pre-mRNA cleavage complex 2 protein Pcf11